MTNLTAALFLSCAVLHALTVAFYTNACRTHRRTGCLLRDARSILDEAKRPYEEARRLAAEPKRDEADWWKD